MQVNVLKWIEENKASFAPPVCNKLMHHTQTSVMFVGGPNKRKDYHIECGEELFYQLQGDMTLPIVEKKKHKTVPIKEGEIFLLPARVPHSPQRLANTIGLVIERERVEGKEFDGLRYFVEEGGQMTLESLYEEWFYCSDLGTQLPPVIQRYFASVQHQTGKPVEGTISTNPPVTLDDKVEVEDPIVLKDFINTHRDQLNNGGKVAVYDLDKYQFQVYMFGAGSQSHISHTADTWMWQLEGESHVEVDGDVYHLTCGDSLLIVKDKQSVISQSPGSVSLVCWQDPTKAEQ